MVFFKTSLSNKVFNPDFDNQKYTNDFVLNIDGVPTRYSWYSLINDSESISKAFKGFLNETQITIGETTIVSLTNEHSTLAESAKDLFLKINNCYYI